ncbi:MAG: DUF309 domain-containing protein [bacterium]
MSETDWDDFDRGIALFNSGQFWESHEAWEDIWRRHPEKSRIFFQGLIQVAAGLYQLRRNIYHGVEKHFRNALWKLRLFQPTFLGINVKHIVNIVEAGHREVLRLGRNRLHDYDTKLIPTIYRFGSHHDLTH